MAKSPSQTTKKRPVRSKTQATASKKTTAVRKKAAAVKTPASKTRTTTARKTAAKTKTAKTTNQPRKATVRKTAAKSATPRKTTTKTSAASRPKKVPAGKTPAARKTAPKVKAVAAKKPVTSKKMASAKKSSTTRKKAATTTPLATKKRAVKKTAAKKTTVKKAAAKKTVAKRPVAKKMAAKKRIAKTSAIKATKLKTKTPTPVKSTRKKTAKPVASKKTTVRKTPAAKSVPKSAVKAKTVAKPIAATKTAKTTPAKLKPIGLAELQARVIDIAERLKQADMQTQRSVKSLEKALTALETKLGKNASINKAALSRRITLLSNKLKNTIKTTQQDVNKDLQTALTDPSVESVEAALNAADARLTRTETIQTNSIARINRHIADLATAIETRFSQEANDRQAQLEAIRSEAISKIEDVERESVNAITGLGQKVVSISNAVKERSGASEDAIKERVSEIALKTQQEFEQYRTMLERRIEAIEAEQRSATATADRALTGLETRLEGIEYGVSDVAAKVDNKPTEPKVTYPEVPAAEISAVPAIDDAFSPIKANADVPEVAMPDAFTPGQATAMSEAVVPPNPYAIPEPEPIEDSHIPQEFNPSMLDSPVSAPTPLTPVPEAPASLVASQNTSPEPQRYALDSVVPEMAMPTPAAPNMTPDQPVYADPAYAEPAYGQTDYSDSVTPADTMNASRPGNFGQDSKFNILSKLKSLPALDKLPTLTPQNLKVAGIAATVGIIGIIAIKGLTGSESQTSAPTNVVASTTPVATGGLQPLNQLPSIETAPTIGEYADNRVDIAPIGSPQASTLETSANSGDPVAEFQLGVAYLETGRTKEAIALIRKAADSGQPAAQYRLAKLYEVGEGVTQNADMARQLTERAARAGNRIAMHDLALYYAEGRGGVETDLEAAAQWFEKAATRGVVDSQFNLGVLFEMGKGVPQNPVDSYVWYGIASQQGDQFAKQRIGNLANNLSAEDRTRGDQRISAFKPAKIDEAANGIFKNLPWTAKTPGVKPTQVKQAQTLLNTLGYDAGGADGAIGPKTRTAITSFERANGMPETGQVSDNLIEQLEIASGA